MKPLRRSHLEYCGVEQRQSSNVVIPMSLDDEDIPLGRHLARAYYYSSTAVRAFISNNPLPALRSPACQGAGGSDKT